MVYAVESGMAAPLYRNHYVSFPTENSSKKRGGPIDNRLVFAYI